MPPQNTNLGMEGRGPDLEIEGLRPEALEIGAIPKIKGLIRDQPAQTENHDILRTMVGIGLDLTRENLDPLEMGKHPKLLDDHYLNRL